MKANDPFFKKLMDWIYPPAPTPEDIVNQAVEEAEGVINDLLDKYTVEGGEDE